MPFRAFPDQPIRWNLDQSLLGSIDIFHPGYPTLDPLFSVHASDSGGIHYNVAYYGCCIIADNCWTSCEGKIKTTEGVPFFSTTPDPSTRIEVPDDLILRGREYYFQVPPFTDAVDPKKRRYPIIPNFANWIFPPNIPKPWQTLPEWSLTNLSKRFFDPTNIQQSGLELSVGGVASSRRSVQRTAHGSPSRLSSAESEPTRIVDDRPFVYHDECCRISRSLIALEEAHIIPASADAWFMSNRMRRFQPSLAGSAPIDDYPNITPLRADVHFLLDRNTLTIVPKPDSQNAQQSTLFCHILHSPGKGVNHIRETLSFYQDVPCLPLFGVPKEYIFARFAWAVLNIRSMPIVKVATRTLLLRVVKDLENNPLESVNRRSTTTFYRKQTPSSRNPGSSSIGSKRSYNEAQDQEEPPEVETDIILHDSSHHCCSRPFDYPTNLDPSVRWDRSGSVPRPIMSFADSDYYTRPFDRLGSVEADAVAVNLRKGSRSHSPYEHESPCEQDSLYEPSVSGSDKNIGMSDWHSKEASPVYVSVEEDEPLPPLARSIETLKSSSTDTLGNVGLVATSGLLDHHDSESKHPSKAIKVFDHTLMDSS
ncbi:hypothetical protein GGR54DRAFT_594840 [Hypoxylon sp. NC1633]|nr:hypothetical protein GGR54DRAFT_594840 [Hypoxylon sp. NC1633]